MMTCPFCSATQPDNSRFCNQCGNMITQPQSAPAQAAPGAPAAALPPQAGMAQPGAQQITPATPPVAMQAGAPPATVPQAGAGPAPATTPTGPAPAPQGAAPLRQPAAASQPVAPAPQAMPVAQTIAQPAPAQAAAPAPQAPAAQPAAISAAPANAGAAAPPPQAAAPQPDPAEEKAAARKKARRKKRRRRLLRGLASLLAVLLLVAGAGVAMEHFYPGTLQALLDTVMPGAELPSPGSSGLFSAFMNGSGGSAGGTSPDVATLRQQEQLYGTLFYDENPAAGAALAKYDGTTMSFSGATTRRAFSTDLSLGVAWTRSGDSNLGRLSIVSGSGRQLQALDNVQENYYFNTLHKSIYYITEDNALYRWQGERATLLAQGVARVVASADDAWVAYRAGGMLYTLPTGGQTPAAASEEAAATPTPFAEVGAGAIPLAVSTDGDTVFYADPAAGAAGAVTFFCLRRGATGGDSIQATPAQDGYAYMAVSYGGTQAVVYAQNGVWECRDGAFTMVGIGAGKISLGSRNFAPVYDSTAQVYAAYRANDSFDTLAYTVDGELSLQYRGKSAGMLNVGVTAFELNEDGTRLTYLRSDAGAAGGGELYCCEIENGAVASERVVATGVAAFDNSRAGDHLYYLTAPQGGDTGTLHYYTNDGQPDEALMEGVWLGGSRYFTAAPGGERCWFITGYDAATRSGTLYTTGPEGQDFSLVGPASLILAGGSGSVLYLENSATNAANTAYVTGRLMWYDGSTPREVQAAAAVSG